MAKSTFPPIREKVLPMQPKKGLEPSTYALRMRRATNCATLAYLLYYYQILIYYTHSFLILQAFFSIQHQFCKIGEISPIPCSFEQKNQGKSCPHDFP